MAVAGESCNQSRWDELELFLTRCVRAALSRFSALAPHIRPAKVPIHIKKTHNLIPVPSIFGQPTSLSCCSGSTSRGARA